VSCPCGLCTSAVLLTLRRTETSHCEISFFCCVLRLSTSCSLLHRVTLTRCTLCYNRSLVPCPEQSPIPLHPHPTAGVTVLGCGRGLRAPPFGTSPIPRARSAHLRRGQGARSSSHCCGTSLSLGLLWDIPCPPARVHPFELGGGMDAPLRSLTNTSAEMSELGPTGQISPAGLPSRGVPAAASTATGTPAQRPIGPHPLRRPTSHAMQSLVVR